MPRCFKFLIDDTCCRRKETKVNTFGKLVFNATIYLFYFAMKIEQKNKNMGLMFQTWLSNEWLKQDFFLFALKIIKNRNFLKFLVEAD